MFQFVAAPMKRRPLSPDPEPDHRNEPNDAHADHPPHLNDLLIFQIDAERGDLLFEQPRKRGESLLEHQRGLRESLLELRVEARGSFERDTRMRQSVPERTNLKPQSCPVATTCSRRRHDTSDDAEQVG
jgi:hypothetical protein